MAGGFTKRASVYEGMPYKGFTDLELLIVENALRLAWAEAAPRSYCHKIDFSKGNEDDISTALTLILDDIWSIDRHMLEALGKMLLPVPEFNSHHGAVDYLGKSLERRPDLTFRRAFPPPGMSVLNGCLFVEAKVLDKTRTVPKYFDQGVSRFVDGSYAWAMPQAIMLGYVNQASKTLPGSMKAHLKKKGTAAYNLVSGPKSFRRCSNPNRSYTTTHTRAWVYPETGGAPGVIKLLHLWLRIP